CGPLYFHLQSEDCKENGPRLSLEPNHPPIPPLVILNHSITFTKHSIHQNPLILSKIHFTL
ncbi:hypothetical protein, partial [Cecembia sp.]|uniref:hypothetical protein n=1 Tax=Cecembia sp. TaxID=1898110 RepID=UPI0025C13441